MKIWVSNLYMFRLELKMFVGLYIYVESLIYKIFLVSHGTPSSRR